MANTPCGGLGLIAISLPEGVRGRRQPPRKGSEGSGMKQRPIIDRNTPCPNQHTLPHRHIATATFQPAPPTHTFTQPHRTPNPPSTRVDCPLAWAGEWVIGQVGGCFGWRGVGWVNG